MQPRVPNVALRLLLAEAGWTGEALVRKVNQLGTEAGLSLRYQRASVTQWLSGAKPRPPVPELVAEGLSRALGRRVTVGDTGLGPTGETDLSAWWGDSVARLTDPERRALLVGATYSVASLVVPVWTTVGSARLGAPSQTANDIRVGRAEAAAATAMIRVFSDSDAALGGGYARQALAGYLSTTIAPWLHANTSPGLRRELLTTAARLSYLCGFMCFDDELHGSAQHYYLTSLRLAAEGGDAYGYAIALRALSVQAHHLGHHPQALDLAEASVRTASTRTPPHSSAFLLGQLAVAHAAVGNRREATTTLNAADRHLARSVDSTAAVGAYHPASLAHQYAAVAVCFGDRATATRALASSLRCRPQRERRSRAVTLAQLAELQFAEGRLEQACSTWQDFLDDYPLLRSRRADRAMASLRARARAHRRNPVARALLERASTLTVAAKGPRVP